MNKIGSFIQAIFCLLLLFTGCKEDDMGLNRPKTEADSPMDAIFELNLAIQGQNNTYPDHNTIGNDMEQSIHSMQLFVVPLNDNNEEMWNNLQFGEATNLKDFQNPITVQVSDFAFNSIHVYVGANMNKQQVNAFIKSKTGYYEMTKTNFPTYYSAINQLAPFSAPWQQELYRKPENIVMFATNVLTANSNDVTEVKDEETGEIKKIINLGTATLKRVVAKVLLTCETVNGSLDDSNEIAPGAVPGAVPGVGYVKTVKDLQDPDNLGPTGWIRQQDVYYFINNMPRRVKFLQEYEELEGEKKLKPNYNLKDVIVQQLGVKFSPITFNRETIKNVFIHYDIDELYKRNQSFRQSQIWDETEYSNLINNLESQYSGKNVGMYTAENMFEVKENDFTSEELKQMKEYENLPFLTNVAIAAKFTPRFIFVTREEWEKGTKDFFPMKDQKLEDPSLEAQKGKPLSELVKIIKPETFPRYYCLMCSSEQVAQKILTYSLEMHGHLLKQGEYDADQDPYQYPENTFFTYSHDNRIFYTSYGVASEGNSKEETWPEMIPFTRGWSYYYTHINNEQPQPVEELGEICIERNTYYILKLKTIGSLGTSVGKNYIEVHTLKSDWQDGGKGEITLH